MSFIKTLLESFFSGNTDSAANRRQLKGIKSQIKRSHLGFFDIRYDELNEEFAAFIYRLYRFFYPIHEHLKMYLNAKSKLVKTLVVEVSCDSQLKAIREQFYEDSIRERLKTKDFNDVFAELKADFANYKKNLTKHVAGRANELYSSYLALIEFAELDYYSCILKKMDIRMPEGDFVYKPSYTPISALEDIEFLKSLAIALESFDGGDEWESLFEILNNSKGIDIIAISQWKKLRRYILEVKKSRILDLIIAYVEQTPNYQSVPILSTANVVTGYIDDVSAELQSNLNKIVAEQKKSSISEIVRTLFNGKIPVSRIRNYSEFLSQLVSGAIDNGFEYVLPVNYLKSFYLDSFKKEIWEILNTYIIVGTWVNPIEGQTLSEILNKLTENSDALTKFDESLAETARYGQLIRNYSRNANPRTKATLERMVGEVNEEVKGVLADASQELFRLGKALRVIIDDFSTKKIFVNWKEVENGYKQGDIFEASKEAYRKIYNMIKILQISLGK